MRFFFLSVYYVRHKADMHDNRRFFSTGMEYAKIYMHTCLKRRVVINHKSVSSLGSITYEKCL